MFQLAHGWHPFYLTFLYIRLIRVHCMLLWLLSTLLSLFLFLSQTHSLSLSLSLSLLLTHLLDHSLSLSLTLLCVCSQLIWLNPIMPPPPVQWDYTMCVPVATTQESKLVPPVYKCTEIWQAYGLLPGFCHASQSVVLAFNLEEVHSW